MLKSRPTAREAFELATKESMDELRKCFQEMSVHRTKTVVHYWHNQDVANELTAALLKIELGYNSSVRSWTRLKSKFPELYTFI